MEPVLRKFQPTYYSYKIIGKYDMPFLKLCIYSNIPPPSPPLANNTVSNRPAPKRLTFWLRNFEILILVKSFPPLTHNTLSNTHDPKGLSFWLSKFRSRT